MLTVDDVVRLPGPGLDQPVLIAFSPDDRVITFLDSEDESLVRQLFAFDTTTGARARLVDPPGGGVREGALSLEEQLRRERLRERGMGVTSYAWAPVGDRVIVPLNGSVWVRDGDAPLVQRVPAGASPVQDPRLSPDGRRLAYVRDAELYTSDLDGTPEIQRTHGARGTGRTHGLAEYVAQEEMHRREGFWWSRDSRRIAFTEVDETHLPTWRIPHLGKDEPSWEDHRYPFAGAENAKVRLAVLALDQGDPVWMDLSAGGRLDVEYLARVTWTPDGRLLAQVQDRRQLRLDVVEFDPASGAGRILLTETSDTWINLHDDLRVLEAGDDAGGFLWATERTGFKHLVVVGRDGTVRRTLTSGAWQVDAVEGVDEAQGLAWFTATRDGATERHLYRVPLAGGPIERVTTSPGQHAVVLDHACARFVDVFHALDQPPRITLRDLATNAELAVLHEPDDPRLTHLPLPPPRLTTVTTRDGVRLDAALYVPDGPGPHPTLVHVYGGPHAQMVANAWSLTADLRDQWLRSRGWLVVRVDNRGAARRGLAFEGAVRHRMGDVEIRDQADAIRELVGRGLVDPERVGIFGWSYGGYLSAMALCRAPDVFRAAVSGAPVTSWDGYDTHYTERYMGLPAENPDGYRDSAVMTWAGALRGKLLLVHGMNDENVHVRHTTRLIDALIRANQRYELLLFPDERHVPRGPAGRRYMEETLVEHFERALLRGAVSPPGRAGSTGPA